MSDTLPNIVLPIDTWVDIYNNPIITAAGISVGTVIRIKPIFGNIDLNAGASKPTSASGFEPLANDLQAMNEASDTGAWAISRGIAGLINVNKT
jgi:hypothetical protein